MKLFKEGELDQMIDEIWIDGCRKGFIGCLLLEVAVVCVFLLVASVSSAQEVSSVRQSQYEWQCEDSAGNIWFTEENVGLYRYDGEFLTSFNKKHGLDLGAIHDTFEDIDGRIWVGGYLGVFRLEGESFVKMTVKLR